MQKDDLSIFTFDGKLAITRDKDSFYVLNDAFITTFNFNVKNDFIDVSVFGDNYSTQIAGNSWGDVDISLRCGKIELRSGNIQDLVPISLTKEIQSATKRIEDFPQLQRCLEF